MPEPLRVRDCVLTRVTDKGYIYFININDYLNLLFIVGRNAEIVTHNKCFQVPIVESTGY